MYGRSALSHFFFFNDTATTEIYTLSLHDALPIYEVRHRAPGSVAIDEVGDVPAREVGVHGEHAADPVCVQDVEVLGARLALSRRECGDVLGPELSLHGRKAAADPAGLGRTKVAVGSDEQQSHRKHEREHGSSLSWKAGVS